MIREYTKLDSSHSRMTFTLQSDGEHSEWAHAFPEIMPSTHTLHYEWSQNERGMPVLTVEPRLKAEASAPATADSELLAKLNAMNDGDLATFAAENNIDLPRGKKSRAGVIAVIAEGMSGRKLANNPA